MVEIEIKTIDEFGQENYMHNTFTEDSLENGVDIYFLYEQFKAFMKMSGFTDNTVDRFKLEDLKVDKNI